MVCYVHIEESFRITFNMGYHPPPLQMSYGLENIQVSIRNILYNQNLLLNLKIIQGVQVIGAMSMVRNSVGENCYVADEIITSRAGVRLR